jgi:NTE family protein
MRMNGDRSDKEFGRRFLDEKNRVQDNGLLPEYRSALSDSPDSTSTLNCSPQSRRQVVTLVFPSERLPVNLISAQLTGSLWSETKEMVVLVRFALEDNDQVTDDETRPAVSLNGEFHMPPQIRRTRAGFHSLVVEANREPPSPAGIASLVSQLRCHFRYVLLAAPANAHSAPWLSECLLRSDLSYQFLRAATGDIDDFQKVMQAMPPRCPDRTPRIKLVGCLAKGESADGFDLFTQRAALPMHLFVRGYPTLAHAKETAAPTSPTGLFQADLRRLAREICGRLVGLALSSGAAKGFAHVGVIQVLEENGIEVDVVAGASMGAYVGSLWAHGNNGTELERIAREMEGRWSLWSLIDPAFPPRQGFLRGFAVKKRLMRTIGRACFAEMVRPLRVVAGNLATLERVTFSSGPVASAVHASCAVPGICVPVTIDGETYIDGGIVDPLPVDVLREMGVARVIAVDVIPTPDRIRAGLVADREPKRHQRNSVRKLLRRILPVNQQLNYFARGNLFEILMRSIYGAQIRVAEASSRLADLVLRPDICDDRWLDYRNPGKFIALGREAAERHLEEIKALVAGKQFDPAKKECNHEQRPATETLAATA